MTKKEAKQFLHNATWMCGAGIEGKIHEAIDILASDEEYVPISVGDVVCHVENEKIKMLVLKVYERSINGVALSNVPKKCNVGETYTQTTKSLWKRTGKHFDLSNILVSEEEKMRYTD